MKSSKLSETELYALFPHLQKELEFKRNERKDGDGWANVHDESSSLESAILIEGQNKNFPHPVRTTWCSDDSDITIDEVRVEFLDRTAKVIRTLRQWRETYYAVGYSCTREEEGEDPGRILAEMDKRPSWILVKKIRTSCHCYGGGTIPLYGESMHHTYHIEAYQLTPSV